MKLVGAEYLQLWKQYITKGTGACQALLLCTALSSLFDFVYQKLRSIKQVILVGRLGILFEQLVLEIQQHANKYTYIVHVIVVIVGYNLLE